MRDDVDDALAHLLRRSTLLAPQDLASAVASAAARLGASATRMMLVDYGLRSLVPIEGDGEPVPVEGSLAGRAYITSELVEGEPNGGGRTVWLPLLDGTARVGVLEVAVPRWDEGLAADMVALAKLAAELVVSKDQYTDLYARRRRRRPLTLAAEIQWELLPPLSYETRAAAVAGILEPAYAIGGDSFDYAHNDRFLWFTIVDAMGHGLPAVLLSATVISSVRHSRRHGVGLEEAYHAASAALAAQFGVDRFATAQFGHLDTASGHLTWINAGHPPPLHVRNRSVIGEVRSVPSLPLGIGEQHSTEAGVDLHPGDRVLFFTDGVVESRPGREEGFGVERLGDLLLRVTLDGLGPAETARRLSHAVVAHHGGSLADDASLVLLEYRGGSTDREPLIG